MQSLLQDRRLYNDRFRVMAGKHVNNTRAIARQLLGGRVPAEMNARATIKELPFLCNGEVTTPLQQEVLLEMMCSIRSMQSGYKDERWSLAVQLSSTREVEWFTCGLLFAGQ
jgi:hypothetical protein